MRRFLLAGLAFGFGILPSTAANIGYGDLDEDEMTAAVEYVVHNALYTMLHESGHMLVSEFGLPILGREEDSVDNLATVMLLEAGDETFDAALENRADSAWTRHEMAVFAEDDMSPYFDEHGLDIQRSYQVVCLMVGADPERYKDIADNYELPDHRRQRCGWEYQQVAGAWNGVLEGHLRNGGDGADITVVYDDTDNPDLEWAAMVVRESDILGTVATMMAERYALEPGITFRATACGEANAYWHPANREVTYCYEYANFFGGIMLDWLEGERAGTNADEGEAEEDEGSSESADAG